MILEIAQLTISEQAELLISKAGEPDCDAICNELEVDWGAMCACVNCKCPTALSQGYTECCTLCMQRGAFPCGANKEQEFACPAMREAVAKCL